jgi:hypothetical protein
VSDVDGWLAERTPKPPADLAESLGTIPDGSTSVVEGLARAGSDRLADALARPGRVRESAFRLLEADALLTYACEAALESEDPEAELGRILASIGS